MSDERRGITAGRAGRTQKTEMTPKRAGRKRKFTESVAFTAGLAFVIVYVVGMIATSGGERIKYDDSFDAVAVFAPSDGNDAAADTGEGFWEMLDDCLERAFSKEDGK